MYLYLVALHSGQPAEPVGYTLVCSPTSLGRPIEALETYYSILYCAPFSVTVHEFPFPDSFTEEEILALNPHKPSEKVTLQGQQTSMWSLGDPDDVSSTSLFDLVAILRAESDYAMQRHLWETRHSDVSTTAQHSVATPKTYPVYILKDCKGESWVVGSNSPLAAILDTPFCKEAKVTRLSSSIPFDGILSVSHIAELNEAIHEEPEPPTETLAVAADDTSRRAKVLEVAEAMWKIFEERIVQRRPTALTANGITSEAAQFLWLYLTKGIRFNEFRVPLDFTLTPFLREIPEWWGDITTHMNLLSYFNQKTPPAHTYVLRKGAYDATALNNNNSLTQSAFAEFYPKKFLNDVNALNKNFFGDNWATAPSQNFDALEAILYQPRRIAEEEQDFLVRNFCKTMLTTASGEVLGSAEAYKEFQEWVSCAETRGAAAASCLPFEVGKEILAVMSIGQFGATMKRLGYTMKRRAQGNVYLDLAVKSKKKAVDALFGQSNILKCSIATDPQTVVCGSKAEGGGNTTCEGYGPTGPFEPEYAAP